MEYKIINFDTQTASGKTYTFDETNVTSDFIMGSINYIYTDMPLTLHHKQTAAMAKLSKNSSGVFISNLIPFGEHANEFSNMIDNGCSIIPCGHGTIDEDGFVRSYTVISFFLK